MTLENNTDELKEFIFQFLRSDKGLKYSKTLHNKDKKEISFPVIPKLKSKFIINDFEKKAEIDMALGTDTRESRKGRSINEIENSPSDSAVRKSTENPHLPITRKIKSLIKTMLC